ncbi:MAG: NADPH-dependent FMN reductase [Candidatus Eisenbacteria bacterium]|nr:NADPH-dependent FMN reductase [Candidatus Eisenbacteria bacterium]
MPTTRGDNELRQRPRKEGGARMKIVMLMGSPRPTGNTATVLEMVEESLAAGHEIKRYDVAQLNIIGCRGCYACADSPNEPGCVQRDDATGILDEILGADAIVYATPLYMWGVASDLRALMERHFCLVKTYGSPAKKSLVQGKRIAMLVTAAGPAENNADAIQTVFDRFASYCECEVAGKFVLPGCSVTEGPGEDARTLAGRLAEALTVESSIH